MINLEVRLGGIYALERIARDSPKDHWTIMEVLTAYVRENSPPNPKRRTDCFIGVTCACGYSSDLDCNL